MTDDEVKKILAMPDDVRQCLARVHGSSKGLLDYGNSPFLKRFLTENIREIEAIMPWLGASYPVTNPPGDSDEGSTFDGGNIVGPDAQD